MHSSERGDVGFVSETVALFEHVQLNRAGWWEKTVQRFVVSIIWEATHGVARDQVSDAISCKYKTGDRRVEINNAIDVLIEEQILIVAEGDKLFLSHEHRRAVDRDIKSAEDSFAFARSRFLSLAEKMIPDRNPEMLWESFEETVLVRIIKTVGAELISLYGCNGNGNMFSVAKDFCLSLGDGYKDVLSSLVVEFFDPSVHQMRAYISRWLHARFCVEASGLPRNVLEKIQNDVGKRVEYKVFIDTNFLFSLLGLHDNPANEAALDILRLIKKLSGVVDVDLYVSTDTVEETRSVLGAARNNFVGYRNVKCSSAALGARVWTGITQKFLTEHSKSNGLLTPEEWFDPYINNFLSCLSGVGIEIYPKDTREYRESPEVLDAAAAVQKRQDRLPEEKQKKIGAIFHDMVLWHLARDLRPRYVESPVDAKVWILTLDNHLIGYDKHKCGLERVPGHVVPLCISPSSFVQLLQFWSPRDDDFEEAVLGNIRLPFLFQEFDPADEKVCFSILKRLGRLDIHPGMTEEVLRKTILSDGLREKVVSAKDETEESVVIRDALLDEMAKSVAEKNASIENKDLEIESLKKNLEKEKTEIGSLHAEFMKRDGEREKEIEEYKINNDRLVYFFCVCLLVILSLTCGVACFVFLERAGFGRIDLVLYTLLVTCFIYCLGHRGVERFEFANRCMKRIMAFQKISRWIEYVLWALVLSVLGNFLYAHLLQGAGG